MESLQDTEWDVLIAGTGIQQSLLALALSRSGRKVLHIDRNRYYGGAEAALTLHDAETWSKQTGHCQGHPFRAVTIFSKHDRETLQSRAYNLALAPNLIYTTAALLQTLVKARVDTHLEFKAVGSWFVYQNQIDADVSPLVKIPESREDIFAETTLDLKTKGSLVRTLRFLHDYDNRTAEWQPEADQPLQDLLTSRFKLPRPLQRQLLALTLSSAAEAATPRSFAIPRIANHLRSFNTLGPGFNAVVPAYGGLCELVQVACRASAVGGATYVLDCSIGEISRQNVNDVGSDDGGRLKVQLSSGDQITARRVIGTLDQLPSSIAGEKCSGPLCSRSISIIDSPLSHLFTRDVEGAPSPAAFVIVIPSAKELGPEFSDVEEPVHIIAHSSDTGDCPTGQCVLYASVAQNIRRGAPILARAVSAVLEHAGSLSLPTVMWSMSYEQVGRGQHAPLRQDETIANVQIFPHLGLDTVFDDSILTTVREAWRNIEDRADAEFLDFPDRNAMLVDET